MNMIKNNKYSFVSLTIIVVITLIITPWFINWVPQNHPFVMDVDQYYSYLHALFIKHDITFSNNVHDFWLISTPTNHFVPKVTYGVSIFYAPFFLLAKLVSASYSTGYEPLYAWFIHYGCIIYILIGLIYTQKILSKFFQDKMIAISLILFYFGANIFYYTVSESESVHGILFFLVAVFSYNVISFFETSNKKHFHIALFTLGFISLIRPTEIILLLIPLFIGTISLKEKIHLVMQLRWHLLLAVILFLIPVFPQLLFWKIQSGQWFFFSYGSGERFFWQDPQILNFLFSFRKGWFVYTPLALFIILGFAVLYRKNKAVFFPIFLYLILNIYILSCWWDWTFGGSFGMRALVHTYSLLIIPFTYFITWLWKQLIIVKTGVFVIILFLICLNVFQSHLYKHRIIHFDGMTKETYCYTFFKLNYSKEELIYLNTLFKSPNYNELRKGNRDE